MSGDERAGARLRVDLPVLLPDVDDARDACRARLVGLLDGRHGVRDVHIHEADGRAQVCVHYDPAQVTLRQLEALVRLAGADVTARYGHGVFAVRLVHAEDAARRVEAALCALPGVLAAEANVASQRVRIEWERALTDPQRLTAALRRLGYAAEPPAPEPPAPGTDGTGAAAHVADARESPSAPGAAGPPRGAHAGACCAPRDPVPREAGWLARHRELVWSLASGLLLLGAWAVAPRLGAPRGVVLALYLASYAFGAWDLVSHTLGSWRRGRVAFDIDLLMLLAALGAAVLGEWAEGAFLLFLFSLAHALEHAALGRARDAIRGLSALAPAVAQVRRGEALVAVPVEEVAVGDVVLVRPAERIPVDGVVTEGRSAVDQAAVTGESVPVEKTPGTEVFAGTVNGDGALAIRTQRAAGDRTLDRVIRLVEEAQTQKAPTQRFTDRFERIFVPVVLVADLLLILVPPLLGVWAWHDAVYRGMALLVAASPCALALGTPAAVLAAIAQAARQGVLVKGGAHLEQLGALRALAFDKTGTLTTGRMTVTDVRPCAGVPADDLLRVAGAVETLSQHPIAQAVARHARERLGSLPSASDFTSVTAQGVYAVVEGAPARVGRLALWTDGGVAVPAEVRGLMDELQAGGRTALAVEHGARWLGAIGVADRLRDGARGVLDELRALGVAPLVMLTGDHRRVAEAVGRDAGIDEVHAELLPADKVARVRELLARHGAIAMVGDGVNDAPALAHASVGIAMGGAGTAVALETADVALMGDDLARLPFAVGLSRQARAVIRQNLALSLAVIGVLIVATVTGTAGIGLAVLVHEGSTLVVIANALRLLGYRAPAPAPASSPSRVPAAAPGDAPGRSGDGA